MESAAAAVIAALSLEPVVPAFVTLLDRAAIASVLFGDRPAVAAVSLLDTASAGFGRFP